MSPPCRRAPLALQASSSASMPGRTFPSSSSREAPPPVETKWTLSSMFHFAAAVAESPPPMIPLPPFCVSSATASSNDFVPFEKVSNSKTPAGPFQTTVLEPSTTSRKRAIDSGPQSMPSQSAGIPCSCVTVWVGWSFLNSWPHSQSLGSTMSTPLALALSISFGTRSAPFLSKSDLPISMPKPTFRKVYAMPPQRISLSARSIKFSITRILSEILAPPTMAVSGRSTFFGSSTCEKASSSLATSRPDTQGISPLIATIEECAR
mmetsp:Transcript_21004/g.47989  ORF Transcript_21004/g.47989 Transcript_21004/m.47989 type:complete len:264 (-) Transcript_21004:229-1020(-)